MNRQRGLSLLASILMLLGLLIAPAGLASAASQTLTILGAQGRPGDTDPYTEFSRDNGATWHQAYLYSGHPWGQIPGTNAWLNCAPAGNACEYETVLYRVRFVVPGGWSNPRMSFDVKADNHAWIAVNGGPETHVEGANSFDIDATIASTLKTGMNEIAIKLRDDGGWIGFNYKITLTLDAPTPPSTLPAGQLPPPDQTPPTITGSVTPPANANGWRNTDVQIAFACADTQSDVPSCPAPALLTAEGADQQYTATATDAAGNTGSVTVSGINIDKTAPATTIDAPMSWQNNDVSVSLTAADNLSGVAATYFTVDGGPQQSGTSLVLGTEGEHTLTYWSVDKADNTEAPHTATIQIDKTAPTITGAPDRAANANGWYQADVTVTFTCADGLSGVADCTAPVTVGEGQGQRASGTAADKAGNTASAQVSGINIDKTAPVTTASTQQANANGWNKGDLTVTLAATDILSGLARTEYNLDDAGWVPYTAAISIQAEGGHVLQYRSIDKAENVEAAHTLTVRIDKTAPEAYLQFDPVSRDLQLFGQDEGSGAATTGVIAPISVTRPKGGEYAELRTYLVKDAADNTLQLVVGVKKAGSEVKASVISLQYNGGKPVTPLLDGLSFEWSAVKDGNVKELGQQLTVLTGSSRRSVAAKFDAKKNVTVVRTGDSAAKSDGEANQDEDDHDGEHSGQVLPGMVLLRMTTSQGQLVIQVPGL